MLDTPNSSQFPPSQPADDATASTGSFKPPVKTAPETLLPRLGDYLIEQNLITTDELESALAFQRKRQEAGTPILLGQALLELDLIDPPDLDRAVVHQLTNLHFALQQSNRQLENRVQQRTQDLERRLMQIRAAAEITQMAVSSASLTELFQRCVDLIVERFGYYSAAIYLVDGTRRYLNLAEAAGPFSAVLRQRKPKIQVGSRSLLGWVAANNRPRLVADVSMDFLAGDRVNSPEAAESTGVSASAIMSQTRSAAAVPIAVQLETTAGSPAKDTAEGGADLMSDRFYFHRQAAEAMLPQGRILGVLDIQSEELEAFDDDVVAVLQTIASHIASMVHNASLLESARISLTETMVLYRAGQDFTQAHNVKEVHRSLWNALSNLARDSGFPNLLMVPMTAFSRATLDPHDPAAKTGDTTPLRHLKVFAPVSGDDDLPSGLHAGSTGRGSRPSDNLTTAILDTIIPSNPANSTASLGTPFLVLDTTLPSSYPAPLVDLTVRLNCRSVALVPVRSMIGGQLRIMALIVTGLAPASQSGEFLSNRSTDYLVQTCVSLAELAGGAFVRVASADVMEKRLVALQSLNTISQFISAKMDLNEFYKAIHAEVNRIIGDVNFLIAIYNPATDYIQVPYLYESGLLDVRAIPPFPLGEGLTSILIKTRKPLMIVENTEERARELGAKTVGRASKSWLGVPLLLADEVYGAIIVQDLENEYRFDEDDERLLVTLASQVAIAIRTARLLESVGRQAERQEMLNKITTRIRSSNDIQSVLEITASELRTALSPAGVARVTAAIDPKAAPIPADET